MNDSKINLQQKQTLYSFVHMTRVFFCKEHSTDVVPLPLDAQFTLNWEETEPQKSKHIGVRYIPLTLHRH